LDQSDQKVVGPDGKGPTSNFKNLKGMKRGGPKFGLLKVKIVT